MFSVYLNTLFFRTYFAECPAFRVVFKIINGFSGKQCYKVQPVYLRIVHEAIECILEKVLPEGSGLLLHIHASVCKDIAELVFENLCDGSALFFLCITLEQKDPNIKPAKYAEITLKRSCLS